MEEGGQYVADRSDLRKYRIELPNMADDDLDPYEFRLYAHYKRVCGADSGTCFETIRTTARKCKMSIGKVSEMRRCLEQKGYIKCAPAKAGTLHVTIVDNWLENFQRYAKRSPDEQSVHDMNKGVHQVKHKKEPIKKKQNKNLPAPQEQFEELFVIES